MCSQPSSSLKYYFDVPIDNLMIYDATIDLGLKDNMFDVLSANVDNFLSLGYFNGCDASINPCCKYLVDKPRKIISSTFFDLSLDFSKALTLLKRVLTLFAMTIFKLSHSHACEAHYVKFYKLLRALAAFDLIGRALM